MGGSELTLFVFAIQTPKLALWLGQTKLGLMERQERERERHLHHARVVNNN